MRGVRILRRRCKDDFLFFSPSRLLLEQTNNQVDPKFLRNQRYAKHGSEKAVREARAAAAQSA